MSSKAQPATNLPSEVAVLKTKAAAKKGLGSSGHTETIWPKTEWVSNGTQATYGLMTGRRDED